MLEKYTSMFIFILPLFAVGFKNDISEEEGAVRATVWWQYVAIIATAYVGYLTINGMFLYPGNIVTGADDKEDEEPLKPRNFTIKQLNEFDGSINERTDENKPVYLSVGGTVFDCTKGREFYGKGGPYEIFAGHEVGAALAKMSFESTYIDKLEACADLNFGEREMLQDWINKFKYFKMYPVLGSLVIDAEKDNDRIISMTELKQTNGAQENFPEGYATAPIYVAILDKVYDMSFGGSEFYGPGGSYENFAGKNISRALAKMSFDPADLENTDLGDLDEKHLKILGDWVNTFENRKKYPCVGKLH